MLQHWDCRAFKKAINNLLSEMGQIQTSTLDPSCCFRQGRSRTVCASEKEKPSCSSVTKCLSQTDDTDQTKIKTAQKGQQSSYAGLKFSSLLRGLCLQEPLLRVPKPMSLQWHHLELPSSFLLSTCGTQTLGGWAGGVWDKPHTEPNTPVICQPQGSACPRHTATSWQD